MGNSKTVFEFHVINTTLPYEKNLENYQLIYTVIPDKDNIQEITPLVTLLTRFINKYIIQHPDQAHSTTYRDWLDSDFIDIITLPELIEITESQKGNENQPL
jgi:hypothetical protein